MRTKGRISSWNDEKGYGFISPLQGGSRVFAHIKVFSHRGRRPVVGDVVTFSVSTDARGRPCADAASIAGVPETKKPRQPGGVYEWVAGGFLLTVAGAVAVSAIPASLLFFYLIFSAVTFSVYAFDKSAARRGAWRTSENTLHLLSLVGGWPGALVAQRRLRHKSRKQPFRFIFLTTVVLNFGAFFWLFTPGGAEAWQSVITAIELTR